MKGYLPHVKRVLERYGLGRKASDRWTSFSVGKSVTSTLIGAAIKDGHIKSLGHFLAARAVHRRPPKRLPGFFFELAPDALGGGQ